MKTPALRYPGGVIAPLACERCRRIDRIVRTEDGRYPNEGKAGLCRRCGGDPSISRGVAAIGTEGCICEAFGHAAPDVETTGGRDER